MVSYGVDVSVLLLFHARADHFAKVWEQVRRARPARLFLYQDGPRGEGDLAGIRACRELVDDANIDWDCEVHRFYQSRNFGCDPSEFISQRWAFSMTDKCVVLEDDDVPSLSFFSFCKEMLDRYEHDERVTMIAGFNTDEFTECGGDSYFFSRAFSIWGWASWARVVNAWDGEYGFVRDEGVWRVLCEKAKSYRQRGEMLRLCREHAGTGKEYYETIFWAYMMLHDGLAVFPRVNMINNIGLEGGAHYATCLDLMPGRLRAQFVMGRHELDFPLVHPDVVAESPGYQQRWYLRNGWNSPWRKVEYSLEELWLNLRHGNFGFILRAVGKRIAKTWRNL